MTLDAVDKQIVETLQRDGSLSISDLAKQLGMTPPPCWRRVNALKERGVLKGQVWLANPKSLDLNVLMIATIKLAAHDTEVTDAFRAAVKDIPEIIECYILLGSTDAFLKIAVPSIDYYETLFYQRISKIPGVQEVNSCVVLTEIKRTTELPVLS